MGLFPLKDYIVSVASLVVTNARRKVLLNIVPNSFPATRLSAKRDVGDEAPVEYIQVRDLNHLSCSKLTSSISRTPRP